MIAHRSLVFLLPCFLASPARGDDVTDDGNRIEETIEEEVNAIVEEAAAAVEEADEAARGIEEEIEDIVEVEVHRQHAEIERQLRKGGADIFEERIHEPGEDGSRDVLIERDTFALEMDGDPFLHDAELDLDVDLLLDFEDGGEEEDVRGRKVKVRRVEKARVPGPGPERRKDMKAIEKQVEKLEKEIHKLHEARRQMVLRGPKGLPEGGPDAGGPRVLRGPRVSPDGPRPEDEDTRPRARGRRLGPEPGFDVPMPPPGPPGQRGPRPQMEAIRQELHEVRRGLERIERLIGELHRARGERRGRQPDVSGREGPGGDGPPRPPTPPAPPRFRGPPVQPMEPPQPGQPGPGPGNPYFVPRAPGIRP